MAHFAELDNNNVVLRVVVVSNDCVPSDEHIDGETWCVNFFKTSNWKQTSYNHNFRKQYAVIGFTYDAAKNKFLSPQPFASWDLDSNDDWQSPVTYPNGDQSAYRISWDEDNLRWLGTKRSDDSNYRWNADDSEWVSI
jgi:hypothetical protein